MVVMMMSQGITTSKCYYCLCQVCSMAKCPWGSNKPVLCNKSCWSQYRFYPRLHCDFFVHFRKTRIFRVKHIKTLKPIYSAQQVGDLLNEILNKIDRIEDNE